MRPGESCRTCVYVVVKVNGAQGRQWWECHRLAPSPKPNTGSSQWPRVRIESSPGLPADWCGEYVKAETKAEPYGCE